MTTKECYEALGGSYPEALSRFRDDARIRRFAKMFLSDGSWQELLQAMEQKDTGTAFRAAHTLKGVCQNLSFTRLYAVSSRMTELLRNEDLPAAAQCLPELTNAYRDTVGALTQME